MSSRRALVTAIAVSLALTSCSGGGGSTGTRGGTSVDVTLQEFSIDPTAHRVPAGEVVFDVTNEGPRDKHEFLVIRTNLAPNALPTNPDGSVDTEAAGVKVVDVVKKLAVMESGTLVVDLDPGSYVFICNLVQKHGRVARGHYTLGMRTGFTVG